MASIISAGTTSGTSLNLSGDTSGVLQLATNGSTTAITVDTSQNVGIGTASPAATLTVAHTSGVDGRGIRLVNSSNSQTWENRIGVQALENTSYAIKDITAGSVRFLINTAGNVGIGTNSPSYTLDVRAATGTISATSTTGTNVTYVAANNTGGFAAIGRDSNAGGLTGTAYASFLYSDGSYPIIFSTNGTVRMRVNADAPILCLAGGNTSATGTGIAFPATQSASSDANTLDDYEEGTWTPTDDSGAGLTFIATSGAYVKIGRQVTAWGYVQFPSTANGNNSILGGIPFAAANAPQTRGGGMLAYTTETTLARMLGPTTGTSTVIPYTSAGGRITNSTLSTDEIYFCVTYYV